MWHSGVNTTSETSQTDFPSNKNRQGKHIKTEGNTQCAVATKHLPCSFSLVSSFESSGFVMTSETAGFSISAGVIYLVTHNISTDIHRAAKCNNDSVIY